MRVEAAVARAKLPVAIVASIFSASVVLAFVMDQVKVWLFARFKMASAAQRVTCPSSKLRKPKKSWSFSDIQSF